MKKLFLILSLVLVLSGCFEKAATEEADITPIKPGETLAVFGIDDKAKGFITVGCDTHLTKVKVSDKPADLEGALNVLLATKDPLNFGEGLSTSSGLQDGLLKLESIVTQKVNDRDLLVVNFVKNEGVGLTGACDVPFLKGQINETIRANQGNMPYALRLGNSVSEWECLGSQAPSCK